eukprot:TRINITY_DN35429_c0_g1_i1.p1 TRINITY_DN35429_c0_g1~~TRINITY_DN35429_c0_g1_i1.p1  ORF type:complete len:443 (+),score=89.68 TRINITY_DN35429_c0_g1_i1:287-1615(+)
MSAVRFIGHAPHTGQLLSKSSGTSIGRCGVCSRANLPITVPRRRPVAGCTVSSCASQAAPLLSARVRFCGPADKDHRAQFSCRAEGTSNNGSAASGAQKVAENGSISQTAAVNDQVGAEQNKEEYDEDYGDVLRILGSRVVDRQTQYLIEWADDHPDSWEPADNIARDVVGIYLEPWWVAARKADEGLLQGLLEEGRDVNAIDENERTAVIFAAGLGNEKCVRFLAEAGADITWQDRDGFTALHIAAGYVHSTVVEVLLSLGADPSVEDKKGRSPLSLARELLERVPKNNPLQFGRRLALEQVVKMLDEALFEEVEVSRVLDKRTVVGGAVEYLVRWSDESEDTWEPKENIGEDLIQNYEEGVEYGVALKIVEKREGKEGRVEYLVKWEDSEEDTWEPEENVEVEIVAAFEGVTVEEVDRRREEAAAKVGGEKKEEAVVLQS